MAIIEMKRVFLIGMLDEKEKILQSLQSMGVIEISELEGRGEEDGDWYKELKQDSNETILEEIETQISGVEFALEFIKGYSEKKKDLFAGRHEIHIEELKRTLDSREELLKVVDQCRGLERELTELRTQETRLTNLINQMEPWQGLDLPIEEVHDTAKVKVLIGTVDKEAASDFEDALAPGGFRPLYMKQVGESREETYFLIIYHRSLENEVSSYIREFNFNKTTFSSIKGVPRQIIDDAKKEMEAIEEKRAKIAEKAKQLSVHQRNLEILYDGLSIERDRIYGAQNLFRTGKTFFMKGWIPVRLVDDLKSRLSRTTRNYYVWFEDPREDEVFPVALDNPPLVKPFEMITDLYSTPSSKGIDPNLYMAPFYFAFFGMMVSDAGYGIILAIAAAYLTKKLKLRGTGKKLGWLISLGGVSTFLWGAIFGGWFGDAGTALGIPPLWFNPMEEPLVMLGLCFGLGILQVFVGMGLQAYMNIRRGRILDAIFDQGLWYVFLIGLMVLGAGSTLGNDVVADVGKAASIVGAVGLVLTQGRNQKGIIKKFLSGLLSLYNTTGFLSDVLSYSRLFALGLATGVIAMVINQLGTMLGTSWIGWIFAAVILVGGHIFNILINVLGAFVHASRLQYIEFFGKFFEGGGHAFQPLAVRTKYTDIKGV